MYSLSKLIRSNIINIGNFSTLAKSKTGPLRITRISAYQVDLPLHEKTYKWANGKSVEVFDATIVKIETNRGITGFGENTPLGPNYLAAYAKGSRAGISELAPNLIGLDPSNINHINVTMDNLLKGIHGFLLDRHSF